MIRRTERNNFIWLTRSLIGMLVAGAFTDQYPHFKAMPVLEFSSVALLLVAL